jgi:hypothetical protein
MAKQLNATLLLYVHLVILRWKVYLNWLQLNANKHINNYCEFQFSLILCRLMKRN